MKRQTLDDLKNIMTTLRGPKGCPWDKEQTPETLTSFAVEESLELEDAILHEKNPELIKEELGDLLFQVVFQSRMHEEQGLFNLDDVIDHLCKKMVERHPHVFANSPGAKNSDEVLANWEERKSQKLKEKTHFQLPKNLPALLSSVKIGKKTKAIRFDWSTPKEVFRHFLSEVKEFEATLKGRSQARREEELGDALFTLAQVARHLQLDPEKALRRANRKFVDRLRAIHKLSGLPWREFCTLSQKEKDLLWKKNKKKKTLKK